MNETQDVDPRSGIRAVFLTGFLAAEVAGFLYLAVSRTFLLALSDPLAFAGAFLGVGLLGLLSAGVCGLPVRLALGDQKAATGWAIPIFVAGIVSFAVGLAVPWVVLGALRVGE